MYEPNQEIDETCEKCPCNNGGDSLCEDCFNKKLARRDLKQAMEEVMK